MSPSFVGRWRGLLCLLCYLILIARYRVAAAAAAAAVDENRPYEFSFNIVDFQHRFEKKDANGLINGEYGFITADGVYHETGYATDENGDFIITRMRNRKITSLKDAQEIFKDRPEAAKKLLEAVARACGGCKVLDKQGDDRPKVPAKPSTERPPQKKLDPILKQMMKILTGNVKRVSTKNQTEDVVRSMVRAAKKLLSREEDGPTNKGAAVSDRTLEKMANDLYYQFNYTITTHGHHEDGYRGGSKNGSYRTRGENGVDTQVRYLSNEFGHQPNITFLPRAYAADEEHALKGYSFRWYWQ